MNLWKNKLRPATQDATWWTITFLLFAQHDVDDSVDVADVDSSVAVDVTRLDLLAVQGTLKSLLQHHSAKASILQRSAFFTVQLSHPYMTTGKIIALTRRTFFGKGMSLLFNMLSRLAITFLPRTKGLLNFMAAVTISSDFGAPKSKVSHCFHCFSIYFPWSDGTGSHDLSFLNIES